MQPALPPSSSVTRLRPARRFISQPTTGEPVKVSSLKRSSSTSAVASLLFIGSTLSAAAGQPASRMIPASVSAEIGVCEAGLSTTGQPAAIAGASLCATRFSGKLNGEIAAIGPIGKRRTMPWRPSPPGVASRCSSSSWKRVASSAAAAKVAALRPTSTRACLIGLPASSAIMRASGSARAAISSDTLRSTAARLWPGSLRVTSNAATAAWIACSSSSGPARCTVPTGAPS